VGDENHVVFDQKFFGGKGNVMCCHDATAISFVARVRGEVFAYFHAVTEKVTVVCRIDSLACQDDFFVNNALNVKENDEHALDFALHLSHFFQYQ
jgi:hypothetical protein